MKVHVSVEQTGKDNKGEYEWIEGLNLALKLSFLNCYRGLQFYLFLVRLKRKTMCEYNFLFYARKCVIYLGKVEQSVGIFLSFLTVIS